MARMHGFGLVEIMIAMTLGLLLLAGLYQVYLANKTTFRTQQALARLQENTRYVVQTLSHDLRMAGYAGCVRLDNLTVNVIADGLSATAFDLANFVSGVNGQGTASDTITIKGASGDAVRLTGNMDSDNANIQIDANPDNLEAGDLVFISDCGSADIFSATSVSKGTKKITIAHASGNTSNRLSKAYQEQARISAFRAITYSVGNSKTSNFPNGGAVPALFRQINGGTPAELVQGVQNMQIQYGVNTDGDAKYSADTYTNVVTDWSRVVSVRVALLMESLTPATDTPDKTSTYTLLDQTVGPFNDRHLRRAITFTVAIRNRVH